MTLWRRVEHTDLEQQLREPEQLGLVSLAGSLGDQRRHVDLVTQLLEIFVGELPHRVCGRREGQHQRLSRDRPGPGGRPLQSCRGDVCIGEVVVEQQLGGAAQRAEVLDQQQIQIRPGTASQDRPPEQWPRTGAAQVDQPGLHGTGHPLGQVRIGHQERAGGTQPISQRPIGDAQQATEGDVVAEQVVIVLGGMACDGGGHGCITARAAA